VNPTDLKLPMKGFTKSERVWLEELIEVIKTVHAVSGRNVSISDSDSGQVVNAADCEPCP
jgi:hypothetical protein